VGLYLLLFAGAVALGLLVRELWRGFAPRMRLARQQRLTEKETAAAPGGRPDRPVVVTSASVVEGVATREPCVMCGQPVYVEEHAVETHGDDRLRAVRVGCRFCEHQRLLYVRIDEPSMLH